MKLNMLNLSARNKAEEISDGFLTLIGFWRAIPASNQSFEVTPASVTAAASHLPRH